MIAVSVYILVSIALFVFFWYLHCYQYENDMHLDDLLLYGLAALCTPLGVVCVCMIAGEAFVKWSDTSSWNLNPVIFKGKKK